MKVALAQRDALIGDPAWTAAVAALATAAAAQGAALLVLPELATCGYPPRDLLDRQRFVGSQWRQVQELAQQITLPILLGAVEPLEDGRFPRLANVLLLLDRGRIAATYRKRLLPTYDVFDERRHFRPGDGSCIVTVAGKRIALTVCEDIWGPDELGFAYEANPVAEAAGRCDLLINIAASPFHLGKVGVRRQLLARVARQVGAPVLYVNQVGAQDELLFDGDSAVHTADGSCLARLPRWQESMRVIDLAARPEPEASPLEPMADLHAALVAGIRGYCHKTGQRRVVLGLSGGIDSAVVATLATDALGPDAVTGVLMPGPYSSPGSVSDAQELADRLGIRAVICPISQANAVMLDSLVPVFAGTPPGLAEENLQSRLRGAVVMALANKTGAMALTTGNKSELAVGYCTIYGDMNGGLAPIGDVYKTAVSALARWLNRDGVRIPVSSIEKPPSAELRPDQTDEASLGSYAVLDRILKGYLEDDLDAAALVAAGLPEAEVRRTLRLVELNEWKRRQAAPVLRVSPKAFGMGRRMPLARAIPGH